MFFRLNFRLSRCVLTTASNISYQYHKYQISPKFWSHSSKHNYIWISNGSNNRYVLESHIPRPLSLALLFFSSAENFIYLSTLFNSASTIYSAAVYHHGQPSCAWVVPQQEIHRQPAKTKSTPTSALRTNTRLTDINISIKVCLEYVWNCRSQSHLSPTWATP